MSARPLQRRRGLGLWMASALVIGNMVGSGVFLLPSSLAKYGGISIAAWVRHPMPYGDLQAMRVQRFAALADSDASNPTIEEREEYEEPVRQAWSCTPGWTTGPSWSARRPRPM
jgi:hypothetical protein